ncbi:MAG: NAD-dependent epimerase/dehydratase family protein [Thermoanaerobaculum sp.]
MSGTPQTPLVPPLAELDLRAFCLTIPQPVGLTGATGFVGSHLLEALLSGGASVRVLVRDPGKLPAGLASRVEVVVGDLADRQALERFAAGVGILLHLAGVVRAPKPEAFFAANAEGTQNLVFAAQASESRPRLVYVSSLAAAGPSPAPEGKLPEDPPAPVSAYGRSKLAGERAVAAYPGAWLILRPPAIYGPRDRDVFQFFKMASRGWLPFPAGDRYVTVAFVGDVVLSVLKAASSSLSGKVLHLGEKAPYPLRELLAKLAAAGGVRARIVPLPGMVFRLAGFVGDGLHLLGWRDVPMTSDKARELLARHWTAHTQASLQALGLPEPVPFPRGAELTWRWYRNHGWLPHGRI